MVIYARVCAVCGAYVRHGGGWRASAARRKRYWSCVVLRRRVLIASDESRKMSARLCVRGRSPMGRYSGRGEVQVDVVQEVRPPAACAHMWGKSRKRLLKVKYRVKRRMHKA